MKSVAKNTSDGFTLVEVLIVVAILGILAAVIVPEYRNYTQKAKESAAKENIQILRSTIERYAVQHNGIGPGYPGDDPIKPALETAFYLSIVRGNYISEIPKNPFNGLKNIRVIANDEPFPVNATGSNGWVYKPLTKNIRLDWPGTDSDGISYFNY